MKYVIAAFVLILWIGCNTQKNINKPTETDKAEIENVRWSLVEFDGKPVPVSVVGRVSILLSDEGKKLSGFNGCNQLMGSYEVSGGLQVSFSSIATTRRACPETDDWNEMEFNQMLEEANNYTINGDKLMLNVGKRASLAVFVKTEEKGIANKYWKLIKLDGKTVQMAATQEREQYFILRHNNAVTGFAGCNLFSGSYTLEKSKLRIKFSDMLSTLRACPGVEVDESEFLQVFELADNYALNGDTLMLNVGRRAPLAVFEAVYF